MTFLIRVWVILPRMGIFLYGIAYGRIFIEVLIRLFSGPFRTLCQANKYVFLALKF